MGITREWIMAVLSGSAQSLVQRELPPLKPPGVFFCLPVLLALSRTVWWAKMRQRTLSSSANDGFNCGKQSTQNSDSWTYTDLLSDRLQVMMPLVPGLVMSLIHDDDLSKTNVQILEEMVSAMRGSFNRNFGILLAPLPQRRSSNV